jgi:type I restriction enzyme S subunit
MLKLKLGEFLTERKIRYKPSEANQLGFLRIEKIDFNGNIHLVENKPTKTDMILVKPYDLIISGINVQKGALGIYSGNGNALATIHYSSYEYDKSIIDLDYFKYFLQSSKFIRELELQTGSGIKTELKPKKFLNLSMELPSIDRQKQIAYLIRNSSAQLDKLNIKIVEQEILLKKLYDSILQDAISGKLMPQNSHDESAVVLLEKIQSEKIKLINEGKLKKEKPLPKISSNEIPFDLPHGWVWARLGELFTLNYGKGLLSGRSSFSAINCYPAYGSNGIVGYVDNYLTDKPTIIIGRKGSAGALKFCDTPSYTTDVAYYVEKSEFINFHFAYIIFQSLKLKNLSKGVKPGLSRADVYQLVIGVPPLQEQKLIVDKIECLLKKYFQLKENMNLIKINANNLLQSVLNEYF